MAQATYTVPETATYRSDDGRSVYRYEAGAVIPLETAVFLNMPGAVMPDAPDSILFTVFGDTITARDQDGEGIGSDDDLAALWSSVTAGMRVTFDAGTFPFTAALTVPTGVQISGAGAGLTILARTGTGNGFTITGVDATRITGVTIRDLTITGPSVSGTQVQGSGVYATYYDRLTVQRCNISGFGSLGDDAGIAVQIGTGATLADNYLTANKNGICGGAPTATTDIRAQRTIIDRNRCYANFDDGIHLQRCVRNVITKNICWGHPGGGAVDGAGIDVLGDEYDVISGNICFGNARGIEVGNTANGTYPDIGHTITGNQCLDNTEYGVSLIAGAARCTIADNIIEGNDSVGIRFGTATASQAVVDVTVSNNQIHNNATKGIDIFGYVTRPTIQDNKLSGHSTCDIHIRISTGTPATVALLDNRTLSTTGITDAVAGVGFVTRLFGA